MDPRRALELAEESRAELLALLEALIEAPSPYGTSGREAQDRRGVPGAERFRGRDDRGLVGAASRSPRVQSAAAGDRTSRERGRDASRRPGIHVLRPRGHRGAVGGLEFATHSSRGPRRTRPRPRRGGRQGRARRGGGGGRAPRAGIAESAPGGERPRQGRRGAGDPPGLCPDRSGRFHLRPSARERSGARRAQERKPGGRGRASPGHRLVRAASGNRDPGERGRSRRAATRWKRASAGSSACAGASSPTARSTSDAWLPVGPPG